MSKKEAQPVIEMEDMDVEGLDLMEVDEVAEALVQAEAPAKEKKAKKEKKEKGEGLTSTKALAEDEVGASYIAGILKVDARELRGFLRKHFRNMETDKTKRYCWKKEDPQIQEIVDAFKASKEKSSALTKEDKAKKAADKKAALAEKIDEQITAVEEVDIEEIEL